MISRCAEVDSNISYIEQEIVAFPQFCCRVSFSHFAIKEMSESHPVVYTQWKQLMPQKGLN